METNDAESLGKIVAHQLRWLRETNGWSLATLASKMGTTAPTIQKLERLERKIDLNWIERIAAAFEINPLSLFINSPHGGMDVKYVPIVKEFHDTDFDKAIDSSNREIPIVNVLAPGENVFAAHSSRFPMEKLLAVPGYAICDREKIGLRDGKTYMVWVLRGKSSHDMAIIVKFTDSPARLKPLTETVPEDIVTIGRDPFLVIGEIVAFVGSDTYSDTPA